MLEEVEQKVIKEYSEKEVPMASGVSKVIRGFYLRVTNGPTVVIQPGQLVELSRDTASTLFHIGKIEPVNVPSQFKVVRRFKMTEHGRYVDLRPGDIVGLEKEEALEYWRKNYVIPKEEV